MTVEQLELIITANTNELRKELKKTQESLTGIEKTSIKSSNGMLKGFRFLKTGIIALGIGKLVQSIMGGMNGAISRLDTLNNYPRVMSNLGVNSKDAYQSIKMLSDKLQGLPTTLNDAVGSVQRFTSSNNNVKASTEMFLALNNAVLAGGAPLQQQSTALEQLSQAYAKGKPDMMEWRSAVSAMPAQLKQVGLSMGYISADALGEALRSGKISMNDFMFEMMKLNKQGYGGFASFEKQARNSTGGVATSITNVRTAITRGVADIMNAIGQSNIAGFFQMIARAISTASSYIVAFVKVTVMAVSWVSKLFGGSKAKANNISSAAEQTASSMSNLGSSTSGAADNIDGATGSAKKLKKELLGLSSFDEMNVLKDSNNDSSSGGGGSSGSAGANMDLSGLNIDWGEQETGVDKVNQKVQAMVGFFKSIWDTAPVQAFVGGATSILGFYYNYYKEMGKMLIENSIQTWENIKGNVGQIISNLGELFTSFWTDMDLAVQEYTGPIIEKIVGFFDKIWKNVFDPYLKIITGIWADFTGIILKLWNKHGAEILDKIGKAVLNIIDLFQSIWDNILEPIVKPFLEQMSWLWDKYIKDMVNRIGEFVGKLIIAALDIWNNFISPIVGFLLKTLGPGFKASFEFIAGVVGSVVGSISGFIGGLMKSLGGVMDFISGVLTGNWQKAWNGLRDISKGAMDSLVAIVKLPINIIIDLLNTFFTGLNKIKIPDWVPGFGGKSISIPKIPKLAQGGIVSRPTLAVVGDAGKEAVMPLEKNTGWITDLANKISSINNSPAGNMQITVNLGDETLFRKFIDFVNDKSFQNNEAVIRV